MSLIKNRKVDASKIDGVIDISHIPAAALERLVKVENKDARLALTIKDVQKGDSVQQLDTKNIYMVADDTKLNSEDGYVQYTAAASGGGGHNIYFKGETLYIQDDGTASDGGTPSNLANVESDPTASRDFTAGEYVTVAGTLYKVVSTIASGTAWTDVKDNTAYMTPTNVGSEISALNNQMADVATKAYVDSAIAALIDGDEVSY